MIHQNIHGIIASDIDYDIPMQGYPKYLGMIPNPINLEKLPYIPLNIEDKIVTVVVLRVSHRRHVYKKEM